jgi:hypothetical protein
MPHENIFTQADSRDELRRNAIEVVNAFFFDRLAPATIRLHLVRDEVCRSREDSPGYVRPATG